MKMTKKISAIILCIMLALTAVSCGEDSAWIAKTEDSQVTAGIYIYYLLGARETAKTKIPEKADLFASEIEGKSAETWIRDEALRLTKEHIFVEDAFAKASLKLPDGEKEYAEMYLNYIWQYYGEEYTRNGVSKESAVACMLNTSKRTELFNYMYGKDGEREIPQADIDKWLSENVARAKTIVFSITDDDNKVMTGEALTNVENLAKSFYERLENGEDIDALADEYYDSLEETTSSEETSSEVTSSEEASSEAVSSEVASVEETSSEVTSSEKLIKDMTDEEYTQATRNESVFLLNNTSLKEENTKKVFALKDGEYTMFTDSKQIVIAKREPLFEDTKVTEAYTSSARTGLKGDEFNTYVSDEANKMTVEINQKAVDKFSPKKMELKEPVFDY